MLRIPKIGDEWVLTSFFIPSKHGGFFEGSANDGRCPGHKRSAEQTKSGPEGVSAANNPGMTSEGAIRRTALSLAGKLLQNPCVHDVCALSRIYQQRR